MNKGISDLLMNQDEATLEQNTPHTSSISAELEDAIQHLIHRLRELEPIKETV